MQAYPSLPTEDVAGERSGEHPTPRDSADIRLLDVDPLEERLFNEGGGSPERELGGIRRIYTPGPCSYLASSWLADSPALACLMRFLFVGPTICLGLLSDSASRRTPLPLAMRLAPPPALGTFTIKNVPMPNTQAKRPETGPFYFYSNV